MTAIILCLASILLAGPFEVVVPDQGVEFAKVLRLSSELRSSSRWIARKKAAHELRQFDWQRHPEAAEALAAALSCDPKGLVRLEAAESLGRMRACLPSVHGALDSAARRDRCLLAKLAAKKALKGLDGSCQADCDVCESGESIDSMPIQYGSELEVTPLPSDVQDVPATRLDPIVPTSVDVPASPRTPSPFTTSDEPDFAKRPPARRLPGLREETIPPQPPAIPLDRYNPRPGEAAPTPAGDDESAPQPNWRGIVPE